MKKRCECWSGVGKACSLSNHVHKSFFLFESVAALCCSLCVGMLAWENAEL